MLAYIWAEDQNHLIGQNGHLPWHLPADLHYLKQTTLHSTIVMGSKTLRSFPNAQPLPERRNIVLTHFPEQFSQIADLTVATSQSEIEQLISHDARVFIFGGPALFTMFAHQVQRLYVTKIAAQFSGDTWMIPIDYQQFKLIKRQTGQVDDQNLWAHEFLVYQRQDHYYKNK